MQGYKRTFAQPGSVLRTMEAVAAAASQQEAILLVGETGTGKSTTVQYLASQASIHFSSLCC